MTGLDRSQTFGDLRKWSPLGADLLHVHMTLLRLLEMPRPLASGIAGERYAAAFLQEKENRKMSRDGWPYDLIREILSRAADGGGA